MIVSQADVLCREVPEYHRSVAAKSRPVIKMGALVSHHIRTPTAWGRSLFFSGGGEWMGGSFDKPRGLQTGDTQEGQSGQY